MTGRCWAAIGLLLLATTSLAAESGPSRATYRIAGAEAGLFASYRNARFRMELAETAVGETVAKVEVVSESDGHSAPLPLDPSLLPADVLEALDTRQVPEEARRLARRLTSRCRTVSEAHRAIVGWVATRVAYDEDRRRPQDSAAVLASGAGHCVGFSNLTVDLLRAAGIPARPVSGVWAEADAEIRRRQPAVPGRAGIYHRWVESWDPAIGWFFCDPAGRVDFVSALYLPFANRPDRAPESLRVVPISSEGEFAAERLGSGPKGRPVLALLPPRRELPIPALAGPGGRPR